MGLTPQQIRASLDSLGESEPAFARAVEEVGYPEPRHRAPGYTTLLRTMVGQQVSVSAANAIWQRLESALGTGCPPDILLDHDDEALRACGLSRQKQAYARSLAELVTNGSLNFDDLPADDEEAISRLTEVKGIGRWSAEIYLLFAEGRPDIWPAGDLAVQEGIKRIFSLDDRPSEKEIRRMAESWSPHRGAAAIFTWHYYLDGGPF